MTAITSTTAETKLSPIILSLETQLNTAITGLSSTNISQSTLLQLQTQIQQWNVAITLLASLNKEIGDTLKGIVQKF
ncbi:MAG: EscF/YscF/HrpA family type III secretion system needle major subunit [Pseudomonadota bacterium]